MGGGMDNLPFNWPFNEGGAAFIVAADLQEGRGGENGSKCAKH
jgi:hypothetical protein